MKIVLERDDEAHDWFCIIRAEHDGRTWLQPTGPNSARYMRSDRLVADADIEGPAYEMLALAEAIKRGGSAQFKRCAVSCKDGLVQLWSPKNSTVPGVVTIEEANELADQILATLRKD